MKDRALNTKKLRIITLVILLVITFAAIGTAILFLFPNPFEIYWPCEEEQYSFPDSLEYAALIRAYKFREYHEDDTLIRIFYQPALANEQVIEFLQHKGKTFLTLYRAESLSVANHMYRMVRDNRLNALVPKIVPDSLLDSIRVTKIYCSEDKYVKDTFTWILNKSIYNLNSIRPCNVLFLDGCNISIEFKIGNYHRRFNYFSAVKYTDTRYNHLTFRIEYILGKYGWLT